jgi:hypothetical protein
VEGVIDRLEYGGPGVRGQGPCMTTRARPPLTAQLLHDRQYGLVAKGLALVPLPAAPLLASHRPGVAGRAGEARGDDFVSPAGGGPRRGQGSAAACG